MSSVDIVTFHYSPAPGLTIHPNETRAHEEYLTMIEMMFKSAKLFHPKSRAVLLTSPDTPLGRSRLHIKRVSRPVDPTTLMLSRSKAQQWYLEDSPLKRPIVFADTDILFNRSLDEVFSRDFDIAVTCRTRSSVPINGGLVIVNNRRPSTVRAFFKTFVDLYETDFSDKADWYGDQLALVALLKLSPFATEYPAMIEVGECKVLLLPCDIYNFSPENDVEAIKSPLNDKVVLHFKGQRKHLMFSYWDRFLANRQSPGMWRVLLSLIKPSKTQGAVEGQKPLRKDTC